MLYWRAAFEELTEKQKNKYNKKYEDKLNKYFKKMKYFQKAIFDLPKRPINGFILYYKNNVNEIKENKKNLLITDVAKIISEKWNKENIMVHKKYN